MSKVTEPMADYIFKSYKALRLKGKKQKDALKIIQSDIKDNFDVDVAIDTIIGYAYPPSKDYHEFLESVERFENRMAGPIDSKNKYVKVLVVLGNYDHPVKGKRLAKDIGVNGVREELKVLKSHGLTEQPVKTKFMASKKGRRYLKTEVVLG